MTATSKPLLAITLGDPSGIGPEVVAKALAERGAYEIALPVVVGALHAVEAGSYRPGDDPRTPATESGYYDAGTGNEAFGWVPGVLLDQVKHVPRNSPRLRDFVDGSPAAADAWLPASRLDTTKDGDEWATVLVTA